MTFRKVVIGCQQTFGLMAKSWAYGLNFSCTRSIVYFLYPYYFEKSFLFDVKIWEYVYNLDFFEVTRSQAAT